MEKQNEYKTIIFGNGSDWCAHMLSDASSNTEVSFFNDAFFGGSRFVNKIIKIHYSPKINSIVSLPLKKIWFPLFLRRISCERHSRLLFVFFDRSYFSNNEAFLSYIREKFHNAKFVYVFTNIVRISGANKNKFVDKLSKYYDCICTYDQTDSDNYKYLYFPQIYPTIVKHDLAEKNNDAHPSVFYVGRAKDRYSMLLSVYRQLDKLGCVLDFNIMDVECERRIDNQKINYDLYLPYDEVINRIRRSDCIVDIIQGNSSGLTLKVCEAICYNKLLITTNKSVCKLPFFCEKYIKVIDRPEDIDSQFLENYDSVKYSESDKELFSLAMFISRVAKQVGY